MNSLISLSVSLVYLLNYKSSAFILKYALASMPPNEDPEVSTHLLASRSSAISRPSVTSF